MNNCICLVVYKKTNDAWSAYMSNPINATIHGVKTKPLAKAIVGTIKKAYRDGNYDEFVFNNNKTKTLMERFGL